MLRSPQLDPDVGDEAPTGPDITAYDEHHYVTYLRLLDASRAGADWQEREQFDLVGVRFAGHPDLRRIMQTENATTHPLRREFPADAHLAPWR